MYNNIHPTSTWGFTCQYCGGSGLSSACDPDTHEQLFCEKCNGHGQTEDLQDMCEPCNGSGYVLVEQEDSKFQNVQCRNCGGTGIK
jgi:DnaJ-class molecular chaperone